MAPLTRPQWPKTLAMTANPSWSRRNKHLVLSLATSRSQPKPPNSEYHNHIYTRRFSTTTVAKMPGYIVTCKDDATEDQVKAAKQHAIDQGGIITHEYNLIKGFAVTFEDDAINTLESNEHVKAVELDGQVKAF